MIKIITGEIDSGKTTLLLSVFDRMKKGNGIALPKYFVGGQCWGQRIIELATGKTELFSLRKPFLPDTWTEKYCLGDFSFSDQGLCFAEEVFEKIAADGTNPVFIDEIGPLELMKRGFYSGLRVMLSLDRELHVVIRRSCLQDVIRLFDIRSFYLLDASKRQS